MTAGEAPAAADASRSATSTAGGWSLEGSEPMSNVTGLSGSDLGQPVAVHTNHLAGQTSPYLLQHARNPVDWYPWGDEALRRARDEGKPILLSIGYSACHWCHVMERESFEDPQVAEILNEHFISIKVDREERPDLDEIYMTAVQLMTGSGGWPLNVFLTPELKPFYGGTYFPPDDCHGRPGFGKLAGHIAQAWRQDADGIRRSSEQLTGAIQEIAEQNTTSAGLVDAAVLSRAVQELEQTFDSQWGGFGQAPKFPPSGAIGVLLRQYAHTGEAKLLEMAATTLDRMAYGGMYDQLGGGFHRYATDRQWLVPHFEKMLYDNALLARVYLEAWQVTGKQLYRRVAAETLDYVLRDMTDGCGGFHSSEDADSEGEEGKFFVWSPDEIKEALGEQDGVLFCDYYGVTGAGNFEGRNILHVPREPAEFAGEKGMSAADLEDRLAPLREKLRQVRDERVRPGKDDKIIVAWNGMTISAMARGYQVLGEDRFLQAGQKAADFLLAAMTDAGNLQRTYRGAGGRADSRSDKLPAYLDDYAELANALVDLCEATFDLRWLGAAELLAGRMVADFWDEKDGAFFYTSAAHKDLLVRTKPLYDGAVPSGNSTAALVLLRLAGLLGEDEYRRKAERVLALAGERVLAQPAGYMNLLWAADFLLSPTREIAIAGERDGEDTRHLLEVIHRCFIPNKVVALVEPGAAGSAAVERIAWLGHKEMIEGKATVYVCRNHNCKLPVTDDAALAEVLNEGGGVHA